MNLQNIKKFIAYIITFALCLSLFPTVYAADEHKVYIGVYSYNQVTTSAPLAMKVTTKKTDYVSVFTSKRFSVGTTDGGRKLAQDYKYLIVEAQVKPDENITALYLGRSSNGVVSKKLDAQSGWTAGHWNDIRFVCEYNENTSTSARAYYSVDAYVNGNLADSSSSYFVDNGSGDVDIRLIFDCIEGGGTLFWGQIDTYATNDVPDTSYVKDEREEDSFTIDGCELYTKGLPFTVSELLERINSTDDGITALVMPAGKLKKEDASDSADILENGQSLVVVSSAEKRKRVYNINTSWVNLIADKTGESFSGVSKTGGVLGFDADNISSYADALGILTETKAHFSGIESGMKYFIASVDFAPEEILEEISIGDTAKITDGFAYGEWNSILCVYDTENNLLTVYLNGRKIADGVSAEISVSDGDVCFKHTGNVYFDNLSVYLCESAPESVNIPELSNAVYDVVLFNGGDTANSIKIKNGTVKIYTDDTFETLLADGEPVKTGYTAFCTSNDGVYKYFSLLDKADLNKTYPSSGLTVSYNADTQELGINGKLPDGKKKNINFFAQEIYSDADMLYLNILSDENGNVNYSAKLADKYSNRRFVYTLSTDFARETGYLITTNADRLVDFVENKINTAKSANEVENYIKNNKHEFGFDDGNADTDFAYMGEIIFDMRPETLYNSDTFKSAYMISEGLGYVKQNKLTFAEFLSEYSSYLDDDYITKYTNLTDVQKTALQRIFAHGTEVKSFGEAFNNALSVCEYANAKTAPDLKAVFVSINPLALSGGDYAKINNEYYEEKVFEKMFAERTNCYGLSDINKSFDRCVTQVLGEMPDDGKKGGSSGGGSSSGGGRGGISVAPSKPIPSVENDRFKDVLSHWAKDSINSLAEKNIILGYDDGTFRPENNVTRAEFVKIMMCILGENTNGTAEFSDVPETHWCRNYISSASVIGLVMGNGDMFMPDNAISREDAAVILCRAFELKKISENSDKEVNYSDYADIADYAKDKVEFLSKMGIFGGNDGLFSPKGNLTRAEAAAIFDRSFNYLQTEVRGE